MRTRGPAWSTHKKKSAWWHFASWILQQPETERASFYFPKKKPLLMLHWWQSSRNGIRPFDFHWASDYNINSWFVTHLAIGQFKSCRLVSFVSDDKVRQLSSSLQLDTEGLSLWAAFYKLLLMMPTAILSGGSILWSFWWADYLVPDFTARKEKGSNKPVAYWNFLEQNL